MKSKLFFWGGIVTGIYVVGLILFAIYHPNDLFAKDLNEVGDFLAGAFAPPAFLWFILAFLQQAKELRISSEELRNSVDQFSSQSESMKVTNELEGRKLAMAEWQRIHMEMSGILSQYLYVHFTNEARSKMTDEDHRKEMINPNYKPAGIIDPGEFVESSWDGYSKGDLNTFFRTVRNHTKWRKPPQSLGKILSANSKIGTRYLKLHESLKKDEATVELFMTDEMTEVAEYVAKLT